MKNDGGMMRSLRAIIILSLASQLFCYCHAASKDDASIYFNAGTEKYLQGNISSAVDDLEKAFKIDPENKKIKDFIVKILVEAATQDHMRHNYQQAMKYLEKAKSIDPNNPKVLELYQITKDVITPEEEANPVPREKKVRKEKPVVEQKSEAAQQPREQKKIEPVKAPVVREHESLPSEVRLPKPVTERKSLFVPLNVGFAALLLWFFGSLYSLFVFNGKLKRKEIAHNSAEAARNNLLVELEKNKEALKYEHENTERYKKELEKVQSHEYERIKMELDIRTKQIEEKVRNEFMQAHKSDDNNKEAFLHQQQAKVLEFIGDTSQAKDATSPTVEAMRERIALMALNLYEYSPQSAVTFLINMVRNPNPMIRMNVVLSLSTIAKRDTLTILIAMYDDADAKVKREVIKNMKKVMSRVESSEITIDADCSEEIIRILHEERTRGEWIF
jgi:tetratricopeptide (TPR) repeat protein